MSTKIYGGWLIQGTDMVAFRKKCQKLSIEIKKIATGLMAESAAWRAIRLLDQYALAGKKSVLYRDEMAFPLKWPLLSFMMMQVREDALNASRNQMKTPFDLGCSLVAFPMKWKGKKITPITLYDHSPGEKYTPVFERIIKPEYFGYWNNTDPMEGMNDAQWDERGRLWDMAMGDGIPAENGFVFDFIGPTSYPCMFSDETLKELRKVKWSNRLACIAEWYQRKHAMAILVRKLKKEGRKFAAGDFGKLRDWERSAVGRRALAKGKELARARLKRRITKSDVAVLVSSIAKEAEQVSS